MSIISSEAENWCGCETYMHSAYPEDSLEDINYPMEATEE